MSKIDCLNQKLAEYLKIAHGVKLFCVTHLGPKVIYVRHTATLTLLIKLSQVVENLRKYMLLCVVQQSICTERFIVFTWLESN